MTELELATAVETIQRRFGDHALLRASRLPEVAAWRSGLELVDDLTGIDGLPSGRLTVLSGPGTCGKHSLGLELLARASRDLAQGVIVDPGRCFDAWTLAAHGADLENVVALRPPSADACGEAALALSRAGCELLLLLLPNRVLAGADSWLPALEGAAGRSGTVVVAVAEEVTRALAHSSSFTVGLERTGWVVAAGAPVGLRTRLRCLKNRVAAPGAEVEAEILYPLFSAGAGAGLVASAEFQAGAG
ncbi:MAG TPA: hypothetical protein VF137_05625, partial [Candidatus Dormibacteraeota bacterium]